MIRRTSVKKTSSKVLATVLLLVLGSIEIQAEPFETIRNNGNPQNRVDIAILGDGYTAAELPKYKTDVQTFLDGIFAQEPFKEYQSYFNVYRIDVTSNQSGADHPEKGVFVDTALDATYNCNGIQRLICVDATKVNTIVTNTLGASQHDVTLVIVNDPEYGGSGGAIAVASTEASVVELILHEEGHSFGLLGDEYGGPPPPACDNSVEPPQANVTKETQRALIKWNAWIDPATPIPTTTTTPGVPGLYEGSGYCDTGLYRPTTASKMRLLGNPYEQINIEQLLRRIYNFTSPLDSSTPAAGDLALAQGQTQAFSVSTPTPFTHTLTVKWSVDGQQQATGSNFVLNSGPLTVGNHTVVVSINDPTPFVRSDPNQVLVTQKTWNVRVDPPGTAPTVLANISTRLPVGTGDNVLIAGFIVTGNQNKKVIVRAIGPSLTLAGKLADPILELHDASGALLESNDNWVDSPNKQAIIDSTIPPKDPLESAIVRSVPPGNYTAIERGVNNGTGIGVVEAYDLDTSANSKLANISTRGLVQTGDNVLFAGTIVVGQASQKVIIRALGPSTGVPGAMADPTLELHDANGGTLEGNDNWQDSPNKQAIIDSTIPPSDPLESAIVRTLNPGNYTAILRGVNNTTGIAVVEIYALN
jgi:hypothetical protein